MNDLTNSTFRFKNTFSFDDFNNNENQKKENDENSSSNEDAHSNEVSGITASPLIENTKERKILTNWLDAEYNSAFQYKRMNIPSYSYNTGDNSDIDIEDPVVVYNYLKKYTNVLYDCDCDKDVEKLIVDTLEKSLKEYVRANKIEGIEKYLDKKFYELKNKYLIKLRIEEKPVIQAEKINNSRFNFIQELEDRYNSK